MFSTLFNSISFPLIAFIFYIYVTINYYSNKRYNSYSNKTYRVLLVFTYATTLALFFDFFGIDGVPGFAGLQSIFARGYILFTMLWASTYSYYLIINFFVKNQDKKTLRIIKYILYGFNILLFIWSCFLELEYHHRSIYAIGGKALIPLYVEFAVTGTLYLLCLVIKHKQMNKTQFIMHAMILVILGAMTIFRFFTSWDVNYFTYIMCIVPMALYFSSESSAYLQGKELEQSRADFEKTNIEQNQKMNNISIGLQEPLTNILYSQKLINNGLSEADFNNEKIKIYNETKKINDLINSLNQNQVPQNESEVQK